MPTSDLIKYNFATFKQNALSERVFLSDWNVPRRGGLQPDVITAILPYGALGILGLADVLIGEEPGIVELWYTSNPNDEDAEPDVTIGNVAIIDMSPARIGREPGETEDKIISFRIAIADYRRAWCAPRGGVLMKGLINRYPPLDDDETIPNSELLLQCADAMGISVTVSGDADDVEPLQNLRWEGAHAPSEMQRLLEHTGLIFAPLLSGTAQIMKPGTLTPPTIPAGRLVRNVITNCVDRRSGIAVFTSCPAAKIHSFDDEAGDDAPSWKYVMQDPFDGKWKSIDDAVGDGAGGALTQFENDFDDRSTNAPILSSQLYRCIQLDPTQYPPGRVRLLPQFLGVDLVPGPITLNNSDLLIRDRLGSWQKGFGQVIRAEKVIPEANVIIFDQPLMKVRSGSDTRRFKLSKSEVCIPENQLKPRFSVEAWNVDDEEREYGVYGANVSGGHVSSIAANTAKSYLKGYRPNVSIFNAPDLINVLLNGGTSSGNRNTEDMQDRAKSYAAAALGVTTPSMREITVKGFFSVELNACVSEVTYDPRSVTTTIICNGWHLASRSGGEN